MENMSTWPPRVCRRRGSSLNISLYCHLLNHLSQNLDLREISSEYLSRPYVPNSSSSDDMLPGYLNAREWRVRD